MATVPRVLAQARKYAVAEAVMLNQQAMSQMDLVLVAEEPSIAL